MRSLPIRLILAACVLGLLVARSLSDTAYPKFDAVFFVVLAVAFLIVLVPWERLPWGRVSGMNVGMVGVTLESPQLEGALSATPNIQRDERVLRLLAELTQELRAAQGARVLWIADYPNTVLGERRIFRALGVNVVMASSTERGIELMSEEADFDLLITDVYRGAAGLPGSAAGPGAPDEDGGSGHHYTRVGDKRLQEGVRFIILLRRNEVSELQALATAQRIPVIFYAAYRWDVLVQLTRPAREFLPEAEISNEPEQLIEKAIKRLARSRRQPIEAPPSKIVT